MFAEKILELFKDCDFTDFNSEDSYYPVLKNLPEGFAKYDDGATKFVIIPYGADYVIKIPFRGQYTELEHWDEDNEEYIYNYEFLEFECSDYGQWDYCYTEAVLYNKAKHAHVEKAFCKTRCIGKVEGHPIYVQERITKFADWKEDYPEERTSKVSSKCLENDFYRFNLKWQTDAFEYYGEKFFNRLMTFIKENHISDLHVNNIGYIGKRPVILDYASYHD